MKRVSLGLAVVAAWLVTGGAVLQAQQAAPADAALDAFIGSVIKAEAAMGQRMTGYHPLAEVYMQHLVPDPTIAAAPLRDDYFIGQFAKTDRFDLSPMTNGRGWFRPAGLMNRPFGFDFVPSGFAATTVPDARGLDPARYTFTFVRREFIDEVRTVVFDVIPKRSDRDGFKGRIWVDDRDFSIVRFNGISREVDRFLSKMFRRALSFHVDSWRVNVQPGEWLPAYVYFEETDFNEYRTTSPRTPKIRGQMRLWGYELKNSTAPSAFASIQIDPSVQDNSQQGRQVSPVLSQRRWETEAENNILDRLGKAGLLAPEGPVDGVLNTVLNNLQITNELSYDPPLKARVLLTSVLESFIVNRTIVVSRGLIDVLPDEPSTA